MIAFITNPVALERVMFPLETKQVKNKIGTRCSDFKHAVILTVTLILDFFSTSSRLRPSVRTWTPFFVTVYIINSYFRVCSGTPCPLILQHTRGQVSLSIATNISVNWVTD